MITSPSQQAVIKQEEAAKAIEVKHTVEPTAGATPTVVHPLIITSESQQAAEKQGH